SARAGLQVLPEDFAGRRLRHGLDELDEPDLLVRRNLGRHEFHDGLFGELGARRPDDERLGQLLAALLVRDADDRGVGDVRVVEQHGLEFGRGNLVALVLDQLLYPVDDRVAAVLVYHRDVAGVQPPLAVDRRRRGLRVVQVALHDLRPSDPQLTGLTGAGV